MADYYKIQVLARNRDVQGRVRVGLDKVAVAIFAEVVGTPNHDNRLAWATNLRENSLYGPGLDVVVSTLFSQYPAAVNRFKENQGIIHVADEDQLASDLDSVLDGFVDAYLAA